MVAIGQFINGATQAGLAGKQATFAEEQLKLAKEERVKAQEALERASQAEQATKNLENLVQQAGERVMQIQSALETMTTQSEALENTARQTAKKVESVIAQAESAEQRLREADERESLREWAMFLPTGYWAQDPQGSHSLGPVGGPLGDLHGKIFIRDGSKLAMGGTRCYEEEYMEAIRSLISLYPKAPYAYVALTHCLKVRDDPSWQSQAESTRTFLNKFMVIQRRVHIINRFYGILANEVGVDTKWGGYLLNEDGSYTINY